MRKHSEPVVERVYDTVGCLGEPRYRSGSLSPAPPNVLHALDTFSQEIAMHRRFAAAV
jgi:hypothetical protein